MEEIISVIIPVYNVNTWYLRRCVDSACAQSYAGIEIILVDDGSTDPAMQPLLRELQLKDSRIKLFRKDNEGVAKARHYGLERAGGDYLFFMDCDDYIVPAAIAQLYAEAKAREALVVIGDYWLDVEGRYCKPVPMSIPDEPNGFLKALLRRNCNGTVWGKLFHKSVFERVNMEDVYNGKDDNDVKINFLIAKHIDPQQIVCLGQPIYYWLQRPDSATQQQVRRADTRVFEQMNWVNDFVTTGFITETPADDLAFWNLSTWIISLTRGLRCPDPVLEASIYQVYWKNTQARNKLSVTQRLVICSGRNIVVGALYNTIYRNFIKKILKQYF